MCCCKTSQERSHALQQQLSLCTAAAPALPHYELHWQTCASLSCRRFSWTMHSLQELWAASLSTPSKLTRP